MLVTARTEGSESLVLREEEESRREDRRAERSKGEETLAVAQTTWIHDAGVELRQPMRELATQVHDVEVGVRTRGTNTGTREWVRGQKFGVRRQTSTH
jgi:hypothetical protein